jgi:hypothetical protein
MTLNIFDFKIYKNNFLMSRLFKNKFNSKMIGSLIEMVKK